jgi:hypothetical protein
MQPAKTLFNRTPEYSGECSVVGIAGEIFTPAIGLIVFAQMFFDTPDMSSPT